MHHLLLVLLHEHRLLLRHEHLLLGLFVLPVGLLVSFHHFLFLPVFLLLLLVFLEDDFTIFINNFFLNVGLTNLVGHGLLLLHHHKLLLLLEQGLELLFVELIQEVLTEYWHLYQVGWTHLILHDHLLHLGLRLGLIKLLLL